MKDNIQWSEALYSDCEDDLERAFFFACGRAHETGIVAKTIEKDVARAFYAKHFVDELTYPMNMRGEGE